MELHATINQAQFYLERNRLDEAEKVLRAYLGQDPERGEILHMLAIVLSRAKQHKEAEATIQYAISLEPDNAHYLYIYAIILVERDQPKKAEEYIRQAIQFNPEEAEYFGLLANIKMLLKDFQAALDFAEQGLRINPASIYCLNMKSTAQVKLGQADEASNPIEEALKRDPENAYTHAVYGWGLLERGEPKEALKYFREALRLDPELNSARQGMMEALKSQYLFYRLFMQFFFWMSNQGARVQWAVILGIVIGGNVLRDWADKDETLRPFLMTIYGGLVGFALLTWIITPLSNLVLRLNPYGRFLLNKDQTRASTYVGVALATGVLGILAYIITGMTGMMAVGFFGFTMMLPLGSMFSRGEGRKRLFLVGYTILMLVVGGIGIFLTFSLNSTDHLFALIYSLLFVGYTWLANLITIRS
ncbi:MAG: tetratricopeptide repeat protein [Bacteroidota bacterium]